MSVWEDLFDGTDVKDGVADAIKSSISEKQAAILAKELDIASRWALFKLGYKGVELVSSGQEDRSTDSSVGRVRERLRRSTTL